VERSVEGCHGFGDFKQETWCKHGDVMELYDIMYIYIIMMIIIIIYIYTCNIKMIWELLSKNGLNQGGAPTQ
jgi:hypothetical protein